MSKELAGCVSGSARKDVTRGKELVQKLYQKMRRDLNCSHKEEIIIM